MRLLVLCTYHEVASNLPQGCVPQNYAILLFAYLWSLPYLVALHSILSLNSGIVTLKGVFSRSYCCYGNLLCYGKDNNVFTNNWAVS